MCSFSRIVFGANFVLSNVVRSVRRGGYLANGASAGLRCVDASNSPSNGSWNYGAGQYPQPVPA